MILPVFLNTRLSCVFTGLQMCLLYIEFLERADHRLSSLHDDVRPSGSDCGSQQRSRGVKCRPHAGSGQVCLVNVFSTESGGQQIRRKKSVKKIT